MEKDLGYFHILLMVRITQVFMVAATALFFKSR